MARAIVAGHGNAAICPRTGSPRNWRGGARVWADRRAEPGPAAMQLRRFQPFASVALRALPGHFALQLLGLTFIQGNATDAFAPETQVDAGCFQQLSREPVVIIPGSQSKLEQRIGTVGFDLGSEHPRCGSPR